MQFTFSDQKLGGVYLISVTHTTQVKACLGRCIHDVYQCVFIAVASSAFFLFFFFLGELYSVLPMDQALDELQIPIRAGWICKRNWLQLGGV